MHAIHRPSRSPSSSAVALAAAALCTVVQLAAVLALTEVRAAAPAGVQMVQLQRVVVTGKRVAAAEGSLQLAAACTSSEPPRNAQRC